jgi:hypothetical protein
MKPYNTFLVEERLFTWLPLLEIFFIRPAFLLSFVLNIQFKTMSWSSKSLRIRIFSFSFQNYTAFIFIIFPFYSRSLKLNHINLRTLEPKTIIISSSMNYKTLAKNQGKDFDSQNPYVTRPGYKEIKMLQFIIGEALWTSTYPIPEKRRILKNNSVTSCKRLFSRQKYKSSKRCQTLIKKTLRINQ